MDLTLLSPICVLLQECLGFDNAIAAVEKGIANRKLQLGDLESMCNDAQLARDMSKVSLELE